MLSGYLYDLLQEKEEMTTRWAHTSQQLAEACAVNQRLQQALEEANKACTPLAYINACLHACMHACMQRQQVSCRIVCLG